eukprot:gb/GEZN01015875.1/.p1 GENE.gb/GEZN01015875.1/~~gb/GEZN01015875.1/.p1  ORF type:complete len:242 (-),score=38.14 gb/GEZN01015875.1/:151-774(-)
MGWEQPLMVQHAKLLCGSQASAKYKDVLNVGFGLGIIDREIQKFQPRSHTIIEAHPDVYKQMVKGGWTNKPGVKVLFGRWQDVLADLSLYDGIFFDTFGENYEDLKEFHEHVPNILKQACDVDPALMAITNPAGRPVYSYFNGLAASTNKFFHDVYCELVRLHMLEMGLVVSFRPLSLDPLKSQVWQGVKRPYWVLTRYNLPECHFE